VTDDQYKALGAWAHNRALEDTPHIVLGHALRQKIAIMEGKDPASVPLIRPLPKDLDKAIKQGPGEDLPL